ncbi:hypothetical protein ACD578_30160 (plasmid) [Microvirga sp. RSM25]|uniref:hypothetical protein n=1 Tax=Microvirga sp. RSM25 TaxID=3273802 RepID=UPI003850C236
MFANTCRDIARPGDVPEIDDESAHVINLVDAVDVATKKCRVNRGPWRVIVAEAPYLALVSDNLTADVSRFVNEISALGVLMTNIDSPSMSLSTKRLLEIPV